MFYAILINRFGRNIRGQSAVHRVVVTEDRSDTADCTAWRTAPLNTNDCRRDPAVGSAGSRLPAVTTRPDEGLRQPEPCGLAGETTIGRLQHGDAAHHLQADRQEHDDRTAGRKGLSSYAAGLWWRYRRTGTDQVFLFFHKIRDPYSRITTRSCGNTCTNIGPAPTL